MIVGERVHAASAISSIVEGEIIGKGDGYRPEDDFLLDMIPRLVTVNASSLLELLEKWDKSIDDRGLRRLQQQ